ncbi:MAG: hypothetical protein KAH38_13020 [Candidatus Hydrogenedentes bacterium]|nr:hypothetical protein [Candidatus Hydrogenedentota bacterium]
MKWMLLVCACLTLTACQSGSGSVTEKVLADFGLGERPEGYVSGSDRVFEEMDSVGAVEIKRLNSLGRHGEILFDGKGVRGKYYKQVKVYETYYPLDVQSVSGGGTRSRGFSGLIQYKYRLFKGLPKGTKAAAAAESASIAGDIKGKEVYRYNFSTGGVWDGGSGERTKK